MSLPPRRRRTKHAYRKDTVYPNSEPLYKEIQNVDADGQERLGSNILFLKRKLITHALRTFETIVDFIGNTRTEANLRVKAKLDKRKYKKGVVVTKEQMEALSLHRDEFKGEWNYELHPRQKLER